MQNFHFPNIRNLEFSLVLFLMLFIVMPLALVSYLGLMYENTRFFATLAYRNISFVEI